MTQVINNEKVNCMALTSMVKAGVISNNPTLCGTYTDWVKQGWTFYFERRDGKYVCWNICKNIFTILWRISPILYYRGEYQ